MGLTFVLVALAISPWDPARDPLPPAQPAECLYHYGSRALYQFIDQHPFEHLSYVHLEGYGYQSLSLLSTQSVAAGIINGKPQEQLSYGNYTDPNDPRGSYQVFLSDKTCVFFGSEGGAGYQGYDYYTKQMVSYHQAGVPIFFQNATGERAIMF